MARVLAQVAGTLTGDPVRFEAAMWGEHSRAFVNKFIVQTAHKIDAKRTDAKRLLERGE